MVAEIIQGMKIPPINRKGSAPVYPWLQLKPGQAFKFNDGVTINGARSHASQTANALGMKFAVRQTPEGIFCWRVDGLANEPKNGNYRQDVSVIEDYAAMAGPASETAVVGYEPKPRVLGEHLTRVESGDRNSDEI